MKANPNIEAQTIFDVECDHYQLVYVGWKRNEIRDYGCLLHLDIGFNMMGLKAVLPMNWWN